eukprot:TRINITY_DN1064_c0_g1_i4.p1 TRINITY_DN1064_c0_g1~~TRINITY_DN1064_c0_g1_i4.p1  ORF type:complete len:504 (+),score=167.57 TRINITY_DN1064_c0_g1_i4:16-1527(+)
MQDKEEKKDYYYPDRTPDYGGVRIGYQGLGNYVSHNKFTIMGVALAAFITNSLFIYTKFSLTGLSDLQSRLQVAVKELRAQDHDTDLYLIFTLGASLVLLALFIVTIYLSRRERTVYLVDFTTFRCPDDLKVSHDFFMQHTRNVGFFDEAAIDFQEKLIYKTGLGNETYLPPGIMSEPPNICMETARDEAIMVLSGCMDDLFARTGLKPEEIDILIVNCSLFNPTPSMAAMIMNKYKMRSDTLSYNLSGMGCSASVVSIDLAKHLLQVKRNSTAVVLSTENITQNWYRGSERSMLVSNTLFRVGGAAILLSNRSKDSWRAKYKLFASVRVTKACSDRAYNAVYQLEDDKMIKGVRLAPGKELLAVVGDALKSNLSVLGPMVLPWSEQIKFFANYCARKLMPKKKIPMYTPDFKKAFNHFCIHAGGRAVIDGLEQNFHLTPYDVEPSRATLYRYGNTSSSSIWYELNFIELQHKVKKGEKVWQLAFGSGFKCNSAVWVALRDIN